MSFPPTGISDDRLNANTSTQIFLVDNIHIVHDSKVSVYVSLGIGMLALGEADRFVKLRLVFRGLGISMGMRAVRLGLTDLKSNPKKMTTVSLVSVVVVIVNRDP